VAAALLCGSLEGQVPFTPDNLLVQSQAPGSLSFRIREFQLDGTEVQTIVPPLPPGSSDQWHPRDIVVREEGRLHLYNGTFDPYLSTFDPGSNSWSHTTDPSWSTINNVSYGGIARFGDRIFVTNMSTAGNPTSGVILFDLASATSTAFAGGLQAIDLTRGLDGKLWVLTGLMAHAFDPTTLAPLGSVSMTAGSSDVRAIAVDAQGHFYTAAWTGVLAHLSPGGALIDSVNLGGSLMDIDLHPDGRLAVGSRLDGAWLTDTQLTAPTRFESNRWNSFVAFVSSTPDCVTFDFETEDDFSTPLVNGQHLDTEFGALVSITSSGMNAGLGIFDSTVGGPNDPSQDTDLLVGSGNVLILQTENFPPDANDVFPRPNDDEDGGTIAFSFSVEVEVLGLSLIDLDAGDGPTRVVLSDASERRRTYLVPGNWTGDLLLGQPGVGTLDLTTLDPQPGFGSIATASEDPGFAPDQVLALEVELNGSGALDDLSVCPSGSWRASARPRTGSGGNPSLLRSLSLPVLGTSWTAQLDCSAVGSGVATLDVRGATASGSMTPFGEVLVGGPLLHSERQSLSGAPATFTMPIPPSTSLCGLELHVQGLCQGDAPAGGKLRWARSLLTNAVDLVLGF